MRRRGAANAVLGGAALATLGVGLWAGLVYAPVDAYQGEVYRILYVHVPVVWSAYVAFVVTGVASLAYLVRRQERWDRLAHASGETGVVFMALAIIAGAIWGKPTWGAWWTWDARMTTAALLLLIFVGYLMLRSFMADDARAPRYAAIVAIIGVLDIPLIHMSVEWWRTLHQPSSVLRPGGPAMAPPMLLALAINGVAFLLIYAYIVVQRWRLADADASLARAEEAAADA